LSPGTSGPSAPLPHEGPLDGADAVGECGSFAVGYGVRVALRLDAGERIVAASFEVASPDAARPAASALCAALTGMPLEAAGALTVLDVERITALPRGSPVARAVHFARSAALLPLLRRRPRAGPLVVCVCFHVTDAALRDAVRRHRLTTVADVRLRLKASAGCGTCRPDVERILAEEASRS
jgi:bacterioferritin-associated ferredoxin/NifU-like protein involved in Fe-S cluster formation